MAPELSGFGIEYRVIQLFSRDRGKRSSYLNFSTSESGLLIALDLAQKGVDVAFNCLPSRDVTLRVLDADGRSCVASLTIRDELDRIYPLQAMRLAPDLPFQPQIYRADGETVRLPAGVYSVEAKRGPEYLVEKKTVTVGKGEGSGQIDIKLKRWFNPAAYNYYSGDTHIHAAGCSHYDYPTEGVSPQTMIRQARGEALSVGDILTWGPGYYYQKQFFTGHAESPMAGLEHAELQASNNTSLRPQSTVEDHESVIRYDIETSQFPSGHAGHLVLLRLRNQDFPGTKLLEDWPSWNLPILKWAKGQGAVVGGAHCGHGMVVESRSLPNWEIPPFDGTGTNEGIIDVTHGAFDFLSGCDYPPVHELNAWYHILNCGFRLAMLGETDFPCMNAERPGVGRSYVHLERRPLGDGGYDAWVSNLQRGKLYCGDGRSHFTEFRVNGNERGDPDIELSKPGSVEILGKVAVRLEPEVTPATKAIKESSEFVQPFWHVERARIGTSREVPVEIVINGVVAHTVNLLADGVPREIHFSTALTKSSWIALRILYSGHTHPIFVKVDGLPIRSSKRSASWCRSCVDKIWEVKSPFIRSQERTEAAAAFDHARAVYDQILIECDHE
jgi:hypothetical protein